MAELDTGSSGGDGTSDSDDGSTDPTSVDSTAAFFELAPEWLSSNAQALKVFLVSPVGFVIGALLSEFLNGVEVIVEEFLDAILSIFDAIAFIPESTASLLIDAGSVLSVRLFEAIIGVNTQVLTAAEAAGPLSGVVVTVWVVGELLVTLWVGVTLLKIAIDAVPGGGGLLS